MLLRIEYQMERPTRPAGRQAQEEGHACANCLLPGALNLSEQSLPLEPGGKLACSPHSARSLIEIGGQATGEEDRLVVKTRAGATGRNVVSYSIEILQPLGE